MTLLLVVLLVVLWGAVIVPTLLRGRQTPESSVGSFHKHMQVLGSKAGGRLSANGATSRTRGVSAGRWVIAPPATRGSARGSADTFEPSMEQRKLVFIVLLAAAGASLLLGLIPGLGILLKIHVGVDVVLGAYIVFLLRAKARMPRRGLVSYETREREEERSYLRASQF